MVTDLVPPQAIGKGLSLFGITGIVAGIFGFGGAGLVMQTLGMSTTLLIAAVLPLVAIVVITRLRQSAVVTIMA
jgi:hypothetical protein